MSSVNYSLKNRGVRLVPPDEVRVMNKTSGKQDRLNPKYNFVGKVDLAVPGVVISPNKKTDPSFKGNIADLNATAKNQLVKHFYKNKFLSANKKRSVAYFGIEKKSNKK